VRDALRLCVGTLTVLPVRPPERLDARTAGRAMALAPLVGLVLGAVVLVGLWLVGGASLRFVPPGGAFAVAAVGEPVPSRWSALSPLVAAVLAVIATALLTRGMHLDGLADTADGLGSRRAGEEALVLMRRGDVGPFGVATVVLTLLVQVAALAACFQAGVGPFALVTALVVSRAALPLACRHGVPAARPDGLGATVAGTVGGAGLLLALALTVVALGLTAVVAAAGGAGPPGVGAAAVLTGPDDASGAWAVLRPVLAVLLPWLVAWAWTRHCVRRLGGVSGDVLGATVEVACTASLLLFSLS